MIGINSHVTEAELQCSPLCVNSMKLMVYAHENGGIPLTKSDAFNRKFVHWAAVEFNWKDYTADHLYQINKVLNEDDFLPLMAMHDLLSMSKIGRHYKGKFVLTPKGRKLIGDHGQLQQSLFQTLLYDYNLGNLDRIPDDNHPDWEIYMGVMDQEVRGWVTIGHMMNVFYGMEIEGDNFGGPEFRAAMWLSSRVVRPLVWLGLLESEERDFRTEVYKTKIRKTPLWSKWLHFDHLHAANINRPVH